MVGKNFRTTEMVIVQVGNDYSNPYDLDHYISTVSIYNGGTKLAEAQKVVTFRVVLEQNAKLTSHAYCIKHGIFEGYIKTANVHNN